MQVIEHYAVGNVEKSVSTKVFDSLFTEIKTQEAIDVQTWTPPIINWRMHVSQVE